MISYKKYIQQIRKYTRTSVLSNATNISWHIWNNPNFDAKLKEGQHLHLARCYAPRIAVIAAATANEHRSQTATLDNIIELCHKFLNIEESFTDKKYFQENEVIPLETALNQSNVFKEVNYDEQLVRVCAARLFMSRLLQSQWDLLSFGSRSIEKSWAILKELKTINPTRFDSIQRILNISPLDILRGGYMLLGLGYSTSAEKAFGRMNIMASNIDDDLKKMVNMDLESLQFVATKFSRTCNEFRQWHEESLKKHEY